MSKGIDVHIDALVTEFNSNLWIGKVNSFFGRVFRNERFEGFQSTISPEIWTSTTEYIEVLKNDRKDAQCFFDVQPIDSVEGGNVHNSTVWICFLVNLQKLYPSLTRTEATEEAHREAQQIIVNSPFEITGLLRGFEGFTGYDWGKDKQFHADKSPHYLFRFDTTLEYVNSNC